MSKEVEFGVRPKPGKEAALSRNEWVRQGGLDQVAATKLTLRLPAGLHTAFKSRCVLEGVSIQDKVRVLIEREMAREGQGAG